MSAATSLPFPTDLVSRAGAHLASRRGWRASVTSFGLGALSALAFAPIHAVPVLLVAFPGLLVLAWSRATWRGSLAIGWWWGLGHFCAGLYWISNALLTEADRFAWLVPLAVPGIAALLAVFIAVPVAASRVWPAGWPRILAFVALWGIGEFARGIVLTGFPWNLIGSVWAFGALPVQSAAWIGTHGLGLLTVLLACLPLATSGRRALLTGCAMIAAATAFGAIRLWPEEPAPRPVAVRIVQGNIAQGHKWRDDLRAAHFRRYLALTAGVPPAGQDTEPMVVLWPETASPYLLDTDQVAREFAAGQLAANAVLLAGSTRLERLAEGSVPAVRVWNSLVAITSDGTIPAIYDKHHLVPFGEYVPLRGILPIETVTRGNLDFSAGPGNRTIDLAAQQIPPFGALICYEIIFPGRVVAFGDRPEWLVNLTNDAWFGVSSGPWQHLASARLRAVEEGLPLARAANTGISALFDSRGRIVARLGLGQTGTIAASLPVARAPTPYARLGAWIPIGMVIGLLFVATVNSRQMHASYQKSISSMRR